MSFKSTMHLKNVKINQIKKKLLRQGFGYFVYRVQKILAKLFQLYNIPWDFVGKAIRFF